MGLSNCTNHEHGCPRCSGVFATQKGGAWRLRGRGTGVGRGRQGVGGGRGRDLDNKTNLEDGRPGSSGVLAHQPQLLVIHCWEPDQAQNLIQQLLPALVGIHPPHRRKKDIEL